MTLRIDSSRAFRTHEELEALLRAVMAADEHDETSWLEWKSKLDLATKDGQFAVARAILGLSNRSVEDAVRQCEGCGYVIVGADHTGLHGVATVKIANRTESILTSVLLVAELDASVGEFYVAAPEDSRLPRPPAWQDASISALLSTSAAALPNLVRATFRPGDAIVEHDDQTVRITWKLGDIHVRQTLAGEQITLIPALGIDQVHVHWHASASNRSGVAEGEWLLSCAPDQAYGLAPANDESEPEST